MEGDVCSKRWHHSKSGPTPKSNTHHIWQITFEHISANFVSVQNGEAKISMQIEACVVKKQSRSELFTPEEDRKHKQAKECLALTGALSGGNEAAGAVDLIGGAEDKRGCGLTGTLKCKT